MHFSNRNRDYYIQHFVSKQVDVIIIGGGITGAGIALDATLRGMKVALVDGQDFAAGTSSRSTKLIHGGLRYLKQFELGLVAEVGKEREIVYENGPHITTPEPMLLPIYKNSTLGYFTTSIGLRLYDFLAGVKKSERRKMLSTEETLSIAPIIREKDLIGGGYYVEYRTDDARLTIEVIKTAAANGAVCLNYSKVQELLYNESGQIHGVWIEDALTGDSYPIYGKKVVNATGPSVDHIREKDRSKGKKTLRMTKGAHLVFPAEYFPLKQAIYFEHDDGRMIFAIPRKEKIYVGTTDTFFNGEILCPKVSAADRHYLLGAIHYMFPSLDIGEEHIESSWAGVRPLIWEEGKNPSEISRKDEIWESKSGLITIAGGKLTGYRKMAELVVDLLVKKFHHEGSIGYTTCKTQHYPLSGGNVGGSNGFQAFVARKIYQGIQLGLIDKEAEHLVLMYGSNVEILFQYMIENKEREKETNLPLLLWAKLQYALEYEMTATPLDFFHRRTGLLLFDIETVHQYKSEIIRYMANYFGWNEEQKRNYTLELESFLTNAVTVHE